MNVRDKARMILFKLIGIILVLSFQIQLILCYKEYLFRDCNEAGFCKRNKEYSTNIKNDLHYTPRYAIDSTSIEVDDTYMKLSGRIFKSLPVNNSQIELDFSLALLHNGVLDIQVDERCREDIKYANLLVNKLRYNETAKWSFKSQALDYMRLDQVEYVIKKGGLNIKYGVDLAFQIDIAFHPIKIVASMQKEPLIVMNEKNLLNIEHYRKESDNHLHLGEEESSFDMFHDSFKEAKGVTVPLGPESVALDFTFKGFRHVYGIPEHADRLSLKDTSDSKMPYRLFNVDIFEYETESKMPMYGSIPFMLALKPGASAGVFWVNSADTFIDIDKSSSEKDTSTHWISENGVLRVMLMLGENPYDINRLYGSITGYTPIPPQFSLGYHQCRWNYNDEDDVLEVNSNFDSFQIPYDVIWLDVEYADGKRYFTWHPQNFPHPQKMLQTLDRTGRNLVVIIDPHLKTDYAISDEVALRKITIKTPKNETYVNQCWPGESIWIDTLNPEAWDFWDYQHRLSKDSFMGRALNLYLWNDMNEPSVFGGVETTSPKDNLHFGNWEHRSLHNLYGLTFHEATYSSLIKRLLSTSRQRPFILTRSFFAGSQRTAAMWTGDNMAKWEYLKSSIPTILTMGVSGMPFAGSDVGGFFGNPSKELLTRWYQTGMWYPFFRAHAHIDSRRREPWAVGEPYTSFIREAIRLRYSLLQIFYTAFYRSSVDGLPVLRPLFYDSCNSIECYDIDDQFFVGSSGLMIRPVTEEDATSVHIYLPDFERYYDYSNGVFQNKVYQSDSPTYIQKPVNLSDIPILLKGGTIIARKLRYRRSSKLMQRDPFTLIVAMDNHRSAQGELYIDDGETFNYSKGDYAYLSFNANSTGIHGKLQGNENFISHLSVYIEDILILGIGEPTEILLIQNNISRNLSFTKDGISAWRIKNTKIDLSKAWYVKVTANEPSDEAQKDWTLSWRLLMRPSNAVSAVTLLEGNLILAIGAILAALIFLFYRRL